MAIKAALSHSYSDTLYDDAEVWSLSSALSDELTDAGPLRASNKPRHGALTNALSGVLVWRKEAVMPVESCIPIIPSANLEKSLRLWVEATVVY
jgi:hypothetical protein